jgi:hypothetical protein
MSDTLNTVKQALPKLAWEVNGKTIKFTINGIEKKANDIATMLEAVGCNITIAELKNAITASLQTNTNSGIKEILFYDLPLLESDLESKSDLTNADDVI